MLFSKFSNLTPTLRRDLMKEEFTTLSSAMDANADNRAPASVVEDIGEVYRTKMMQTQLEVAREAQTSSLNAPPSGQDSIADNGLSGAIVENLIAGRLQYLRDQAWVELHLGSPHLGQVTLAEVAQHGRSMAGVELLIMGMVVLSLLGSTFIKSLKSVEYDTRRMQAQNYRIQHLSYSADRDRILEEEFKRCASPSVQLPQRVLMVSIGGARIACDFAYRLGKKLADSGARVLIVDYMKDPSALREILNVPPTKGLKHFLRDGIPLAECLARTTASSRLMVLSLGEGVTLEESVLDHPRYVKFVDESAAFDVVISVGDLSEVDELARVSYLSHSLLFFASNKYLRRGTETRLPRLFAVYNGTARRLLEFCTADVAHLGNYLGAGQDAS